MRDSMDLSAPRNFIISKHLGCNGRLARIAQKVTSTDWSRRVITYMGKDRELMALHVGRPLTSGIQAPLLTALINRIKVLQQAIEGRNS